MIDRLLLMYRILRGGLPWRVPAHVAILRAWRMSRSE